MPATLKDNIILTLRAGPASARALATRFKVNPSTITRAMASLQNQVIKAGSGRGTLWYLSRSIPFLDQNQAIPIYKISNEGSDRLLANLYPVYPGENFLVEHFPKQAQQNYPYGEPANKITWDNYESLPWWLADMRPQGYLGRSFAQDLIQKGVRVHADPRLWADDLVLTLLASHPQEHMGDLLIGEQSLKNWKSKKQQTQIVMNEQQAGDKADAIAMGEHFDSSAQGEQPKFAACLAEGPCLVKFSGKTTTQSQDYDSPAQRWSDLLFAEAIAAKTLNSFQPGFAAQARAFQVNNRTLLASKRFDRTANFGRIGLISFASLDAEFVGKASEPWPIVAEALYEENILTEQALVQTRFAWAFGRLIANTDMHLGNISVLNRQGRPYELAPIYDMLPMYFAPKANGDLPSLPYEVSLSETLANARVTKLHWETVYPFAIKFWEAVLQHPQISPHFKALAAQQRELVRFFLEK